MPNSFEALEMSITNYESSGLRGTGLWSVKYTELNLTHTFTCSIAFYFHYRTRKNATEGPKIKYSADKIQNTRKCWQCFLYHQLWITVNYTTVQFLFCKYALDIHIERKDGKLWLGCKINQKDKYIKIYVYLYLYWSVSSSTIWFCRSVHSVHKERDHCQHVYNLDLMFTWNIQGAKP